MKEVYDLVADLLASKADERMIGFAGFTRTASSGGVILEGIIKISAFDRPDGSGYLTLTFIQDRGPGAGPILAKPDQGAFRALLGANFEMLLDIPLDAFANIQAFLVEEMDVYFRQLKGREKAILESSLMPALSQLLGLAFKPLQEWQPKSGV